MSILGGVAVALELENEKLREENARLREEAGCLHRIIDDLSARCIASEGDSLRLDWMEAQREEIFCVSFETYANEPSEWVVTGTPEDSFSGGVSLGRGNTVREAIDAAKEKDMSQHDEQEQDQPILARKNLTL